jgi:tetratricopeptide (TPR) repeat protein
MAGNSAAYNAAPKEGHRLSPDLRRWDPWPSSCRNCIGRTALAILVLAPCLPTAAQQQTHTTVRKHRVAVEDQSVPPELVQAESAIEKKDYLTAQQLLEKLTAGDNPGYQAWFDLGFVYNALGRAEDSIKAYRKSVEAKPDVFESNLNLGLMLARANHPDAEQFLRTATKLKPTAQTNEGLARAWLSLGHMIEGSKPQDAIAAFQEAAKLQPKDIEPHLSAGPLLEKAGDSAGAEKEYRDALLLDPTSADATIGLANLYMKTRRFSEAESTLRTLAASRPQDPTVHVQLARLMAANGKNEDAIAEFQNALKISPDNEDATRDLADLYATSKRFAEAESLFRKLLSTHSDNAELHHSLAKSLLNQRKFPEAEQELLAAIKLKPDLGPAYGDLAAAANETKNYPLVIKALDARAKFLPELPVTHFLRATAYDHMRAYKEAAQSYHRFLEVAQGQYPDQEWQARHRLIAIEPKK